MSPHTSSVSASTTETKSARSPSAPERAVGIRTDRVGLLCRHDDDAKAGWRLMAQFLAMAIGAEARDPNSLHGLQYDGADQPEEAPD